MDILVEPLHEQAQPHGISVHVRLSQQGPKPDGDPGAAPAGPGGRHAAAGSYVIIDRRHEYLEAVVRQVLGDAPDVRILVDRRSRDRRTGRLRTPRAAERRRPGDRRTAEAMIDVVIGCRE